MRTQCVGFLSCLSVAGDNSFTGGTVTGLLAVSVFPKEIADEKCLQKLSLTQCSKNHLHVDLSTQMEQVRDQESFCKPTECTVDEVTAAGAYKLGTTMAFFSRLQPIILLLFVRRS
jgi:hypothetical protein